MNLRVGVQMDEKQRVWPLDSCAARGQEHLAKGAGEHRNPALIPPTGCTTHNLEALLLKIISSWKVGTSWRLGPQVPLLKNG